MLLLLVGLPGLVVVATEVSVAGCGNGTRGTPVERWYWVFVVLSIRVSTSLLARSTAYFKACKETQTVVARRVSVG